MPGRFRLGDPRHENRCAARALRICLACFVRRACTLLFLAPILGCITGLASAEGGGSTQDLCWRGRPSPECRAYVVTDLSGGLRLHPTGAYVRLDDGLMYNLPRRPMAVGGTVSLLVVGNEARLGLNGRYRYWVRPALGVDVSAGASLASNAGGAGYSMHSAVSYADFVGVDLGVDGPFDEAPSWYLGAKTSAYVGAGLGVIAIVGIVGVLLFAVFVD